MTLNSFLAHISDFKNLKSIWHEMLARSRQLEGIFGLLKPFLLVQILICFVDVYQNHGVQYHRGASGEVSLIYRQEGRVSKSREFPEHLMNKTMVGSFFHKSYMDLVGSSCIKMFILFQL